MTLIELYDATKWGNIVFVSAYNKIALYISLQLLLVCVCSDGLMLASVSHIFQSRASRFSLVVGGEKGSFYTRRQ